MSDAAIVYVDSQGRSVYRPSAIYSCTKALVLSRLGYEAVRPSAKTQKAFDEGHYHEPLILNELQAAFEFELYGFQETVEIPIGNDILIRGHIDAMGTASALGNVWLTHRNGVAVETHGHRRAPFAIPSPCVIDAKAFAQSTWDNWKRRGLDAMPYYGWQGRCYSKAVGDLPFVLAIKNKETNDLIVDWYDAEYLEDYAPFGKIVQKILNVERLAALGEPAIPEWCDYDGIKGRTNYICGFWPFHDDKEVEVNADGEVNEAAHEEIRLLTDVYVSARDEEMVAKERKQTASRKIAALLGDKPGSVKLADATVSTYYPGFSTTDWDALERHYPDLSRDQYKITKKSEHLTVRVASRKKDSATAPAE